MNKYVCPPNNECLAHSIQYKPAQQEEIQKNNTETYHQSERTPQISNYLNFKDLVQNKTNSSIFSEPVNVLMTANGSLSTSINLEMLCATISPSACIKAGIIKFIGFNKIYFFNHQYTYHSDENKYFFNQCSFEFKNKVVIKLFSNGTYILTGCTNELDAKNHISLMINTLIGKKYVYLPIKLSTFPIQSNNYPIDTRNSVTAIGTDCISARAQKTKRQVSASDKQTPFRNEQTDTSKQTRIKRLALIYNVQLCKIKSFKIALSNYSISLNQFEFNKFKVLDIVNIIEDKDKQNIESITDIFKYSSVSIKLRNVSGNIDIYKNKVIISVQNKEHYPILLNFFNKYKYNLISLPLTNTVSKLVFLNTALALSNIKNNSRQDTQILEEQPEGTKHHVYANEQLDCLNSREESDNLAETKTSCGLYLYTKEKRASLVLNDKTTTFPGSQEPVAGGIELPKKIISTTKTILDKIYTNYGANIQQQAEAMSIQMTVATQGKTDSK
mgnify:CR=1 FL=1